eukprot:1152079-Pelagomonas_calceolata.AAC.19
MLHMFDSHADLVTAVQQLVAVEAQVRGTYDGGKHCSCMHVHFREGQALEGKAGVICKGCQGMQRVFASQVLCRCGLTESTEAPMQACSQHAGVGMVVFGHFQSTLPGWTDTWPGSRVGKTYGHHVFLSEQLVLTVLPLYAGTLS